MSRRQTLFAWGLVVGGIAVACLGLSASQAQPARKAGPETLLPAGAVFHLGWDGSDKHREAWEQTAAYESLYASGLADVLRNVVEGLAGQMGEEQSALALRTYDLISSKGLSLAVWLSGGEGPPLPQGTLVLHEAAPLERGLSRALRNAFGAQVEFQTETIAGRRVTHGPLPDTPGVELGWWADGGHLVVVVGTDAIRPSLAVADGDAANITKHPLWAKQRIDAADFAVSSVGWIDFAALRKAYGEIPITQLPGEEDQPRAVTVGQIGEALGLDTLQSLAWRSGYDGRASVTRMTLDAPAPRRGLLALLDQRQITLDDLPPLPTQTAGIYASSFDFSKFHDETVAVLRRVARLGPENSEEQIEGLLGLAPAILGFDPKRDLLDPLGNVLCGYGDPRHAAFFGFGAAFVISVDDAATLRRTIDQILERAVGEDEFNEQVAVRRTEKQGREVITLEVAAGFFNPSLVVDEEWLAIGMSPQMVEAFLLRLDGKLDRWEPGDEHRESLAALPREFTSVSITDPRESLQSLLAWAPLLAPVLRRGMHAADPERQAPALSALADLPPTELITRPLFPNVAVTTVDESGVYWHSRTSLSTGPNIGVGGGAVAVALLLPAVQQARTAARRTQSRNNLKQIGLSLHNYHDTHNHFPQGTVPNEALEPEKRLSWLVPLLPYLEQEPLHRRIDLRKAWDDEANEDALENEITIFQNPGVARRGASEYGTTNYVGIAGKGEDAPTLAANHRRAGTFAYNRVTRIRDVTDGLSNTMGVTEASDDFGPWGAGGRPTVRALTEKPYINGPDGIGSPFPGGLHVMMLDGSVRFVSENIDPDVFEALSTIAGGEAVGDF